MRYISLLLTLTLCYKEIHVTTKNNGTFLNCVLNSRVRKFCHCVSMVETCYQLSWTMVDAQRVINWTVIGQLSC